MTSDYGSRYARRPLVRVRATTGGGWRAEGDDSIRDGLGDSPAAALGDWFQKNAERLCFDIRVD